MASIYAKRLKQIRLPKSERASRRWFSKNVRRVGIDEMVQVIQRFPETERRFLDHLEGKTTS